MADMDMFFSRLSKIITYIIICSLIFMAFYYLNWTLNNYIILLSAILCGYTFAFSLPMTRIKIGLSGIEADFDRLLSEKPEVEEEQKEKVEEEVEEAVERGLEPDVILMKLSIDIETTLRRIAEVIGVKRLKVSIGLLVRELRVRAIITDEWLLGALDVFRKYRNELIHEGRTTDIEHAIDTGILIIAQLRKIEEQLRAR